jgi:SAM-dependent methyltransferase
MDQGASRSRGIILGEFPSASAAGCCQAETQKLFRPCVDHKRSADGKRVFMKADREKWDHRYLQESDRLSKPDAFLVEHAGVLGSGRALDPACGLGANSIFLAEHGYEVDALDISYIAVARLHEEALRLGLPIRCVVADLDYFPLPRNAYDLVAVFYFFSETLIHAVGDALKPGGLLFYATYNHRHTSVRPTFNPAYLIPPDGLVSYFSDFDILIHDTSAGDSGNVSRLICRKG